MNGNTFIDTAVINNNLVKTWTLLETDFIATGTSASIIFTSIRPSTGTLGNFLDAVSVTPSFQTSTANVSAPATILLIITSMLVLFAARRKAN